MSSTAFSQSEYDLAYPPGIENHFWTQTRVMIISSLLNRFHLEGKKILEIGCGKGVVLSELRKRDFDCYGVELADVDPLADTVGFIHTKQDALVMPAEFRNSIEVILLLDVIEHIVDASAFLDNIKRSYANAYMFLVMVPARKEFWSNYDVFYGHLRRYDLSMTQKLGTSLKFDTRINSYFFQSLFYAALLIYKLQGKREIRGVAPVGSWVRIHRFIAACFKMEYHLLPSFVPGSSIVALYERS